MEEENKRRLIEKLVEEQDLISLYTYNNFNKSLGILQEYSEGIYYSRIKDFIIENPIVLERFSIKNLYILLSAVNESEKTKNIIETINRRIAEQLKNEDFFCEDIDAEVFLHPIHTNNSYGKIEENLRKEIRRQDYRRLKRN